MIDQAEPSLGIDPQRSRVAAASRRQRLALVGALSGLAILAAVVAISAIRNRMDSAGRLAAVTEPALSSSQLTARGQIRPIASARIRTLSGGVVTRLLVEPGDLVGDQHEIARIRGSAGTEILLSPISGTVTSVSIHYGDTVVPGGAIATVGDLSRLQVETTDVDEFLIARVARGQSAVLTVDALGRDLQGQVRSVSLEPTTTLTGDEHYPVVIDLRDMPPELRPGMTVRIKFGG